MDFVFTARHKPLTTFFLSRVGEGRKKRRKKKKKGEKGKEKGEKGKIEFLGS